ncbi:MAG: tetratricopeptide repeat protein [Acidobacteriota bacterium]|nr:tetratricopeptide repeat protein [Acidobacteriota bacterium]
MARKPVSGNVERASRKGTGPGLEEGDPLDRHKALQTAERLLKQGKVQEALSQLEKLAASTPGDPITLNRMGDMLAKAGQRAEAIEYYSKIADQFANQGFFPKAVAIYKKVLRLEADRTDALTRLGQVYLAQKLPGEARSYLLRAAEIHVAAGRHNDAREIYERLVQAEPENSSHRAHLAETRAAEGDSESASEELCRLGESLIRREELGESEAAYRRAMDLVPDNPGALIGVARCLARSGKEDESLEFLETGLKAHGDPTVLGELLVLHDAAANHDAFDRLLQHPKAGHVPIDTLKKIFDAHRDRDRNAGLDSLWSRVGDAFDRWAAIDAVRVLDQMDVLVSLEPSGHLPALERRLRYARDAGNVPERLVGALEGMIRAMRVRSEDASTYEDELKKLAPSSTLLPQASAAAGSAADGVPGGATALSSSGLPEDAEAPAIPLNRADEEFVAGRLTQAEILEKYGLVDKAIDQIREITTRFPGSVDAQERLLALLRNEGSGEADLSMALVGVALARRAAGSQGEAMQAATEAVVSGTLPESSEALLRRLGLVKGSTESPAPVPAASAAEPAVDPVVEPADAPIPVVVQEAVPEPEATVEEEDVLIEFDADDEEPEHEATPTPSTPAESVVTLSDDADDDLSAITAALEDEMFGGEANEPAAKPESEQSLESVFAAFREQVDNELGPDDYRTHYDLGIGYMEMGLLDEAVREFEISKGDTDLYRDSCVMLAVSHRTREDAAAAIDWFRKALECDADDASKVYELRYDLAELLLASGDEEGALGEFRTVLDGDAGFRDVRVRVEQLESRQPS